MRPARLRPGDTVAAISLSSGAAARHRHRYRAGARQVAETFGLGVIETPHALRDDDWLRRNPDARADDLHWALERDDVAGILSIIGGDDSVRILPHLEMDVVRTHPKILMGFSDTTIALTAFLRAGVTAFHGPAVMTDLAENGGIRPFVRDGVQRTLFDAEPAPWRAAGVWTEQFLDWADPENQQIERRFEPNPGWRWLQGDRAAEGHLMGGNVEVLEFLKGTPWWPDPELWRGAALLLETSEEVPPARWIERWLRNYGHQGILGGLAALLLARPMGYDAAATERLERSVVDVLADAGRPDLPVVAGLDAGHTSPQMVVPLGCRVRVDPDAGTIETLEPGVS
ncbi:MAG: LD-carboxypeptidase [Deinococcus-Thermus bacterium]|nr:LD-carboxypeptidase [Deinococcota bacterium]